MKVFTYCMGIYIIFTLYHLRKVESAAIVCDAPTLSTSNDLEGKSSNKTSNQEEPIAQENDINKFLHKIQCSLEKAKPWMDQLQQEAKRLEEAAKRLGIGILNSFGEFINKLAEEDTGKPVVISEQSLTNYSVNESAISGNTTEAAYDISNFLCPEGFIADHNGICESLEVEGEVNV